MKGFILVVIATACFIKAAESCSCMGTFKDFMCSADFVAKVRVSGEQQSSQNGPFQNIEVLEKYKGQRDISRVYNSRRKPEQPRHSCEPSALIDDEIYLLSGSYYETNDEGVNSVIISGCQVVTLWEWVDEEEFLFLEFLRDGVASECASPAL